MSTNSRILSYGDAMLLPRFEPAEIRTDQPTRAARLKWVIVVDARIGIGAAVNAAACVAAAVGHAVDGLLGPAAADADGGHHPGLPWAGCAILAAPDADAVRAVRTRAAAREDLLVVDMPHAAQDTRVYDEYRALLATTPTATLDLLAVAIVGPRNPVDRIVGRLPLLR